MAFYGILPYMTSKNIIFSLRSSILHLRRNHALEHAALHVLAHRFPQKRLAGHSDFQGLRIIGDVNLRDVQEALEDALQRLRAGELGLAVHPHCGTNYVIGGGLAALAGAFAMRGKATDIWGWLDRISLAILLGVLSLMLAQPLGALFQEHITTSPEPHGLEVVSISTSDLGSMGKMHRVITQG